MVMEFPSPALMVYFFVTSDQKNLPQIFFLVCWLLHYIHRTFIYPFRQSGREKPYPFILVFMAIVFNCLNGFVNGYGIFHIHSYDSSWLYSWQFITGASFFITGYVINKSADEKLRSFRMDSPVEYLVPKGFLFNYISSPHFFGESVEWMGWAIMTFSVPGFAFFAFTFANLFPRAISSHRWYMTNFPDYPTKRKAIIPFII
jgi:hypothetical protein